MIDFDQMKAVADITRIQAKIRPDAVAHVFEGRETTYKALEHYANQVAQGLMAEGCKPDARIGFMGKGSDSYFEMLYGAFKAQCVVVGVNWRLAVPEVAYVLNDSKAELLFVSQDFYPVALEAARECPALRKIIALDGGHESWPAYHDWRDSFQAIDPFLAVDGEDDVIQLYTSGTTGYPKGVQLTNNNYVSAFRQGVEANWASWEASEVNLVCMPLFHVAGVNVGILGHAQGCKNIILKDIDPAQILGLMEREKINIAMMVPAVIMFLLAQPNINDVDVSSVRMILYGASPITEEVLLGAMKRFQCDFVQVYGLTETSGSATYLPPEAHDPERGKLRSCGIPNPGVEAMIVDEDGNEVAQGNVGEILVRGGGVMKGYWNRPDATAEAIDAQGWFRSGDAGYKDEEGYIYIYDRVKDMIVSGAENVYPAEVENALAAHPLVADVAVIGVPDKTWGEAVKGIVVLREGAGADKSPDTIAQEIMQWSKSQIAGYKVPKSIDFAETLPRNPSGKILRRQLREPYWKDQKRRVN